MPCGSSVKITTYSEQPATHAWDSRRSTHGMSAVPQTSHFLDSPRAAGSRRSGSSSASVPAASPAPGTQPMWSKYLLHEGVDFTLTSVTWSKQHCYYLFIEEKNEAGATWKEDSNPHLLTQKPLLSAVICLLYSKTQNFVVRLSFLSSGPTIIV